MKKILLILSLFFIKSSLFAAYDVNYATSLDGYSIRPGYYLKITQTFSVVGNQGEIAAFPHTYSFDVVDGYVDHGKEINCVDGYLDGSIYHCNVGTGNYFTETLIPDCEEGSSFNVETQQCEIVDTDHDDDGLPNKCDPDYVDFLNMNCDDDDLLNGVDSDIDGDDILNGNDSNPYVNDSNSEDSNKICPATSLKVTPVKDEGSCSMSNPLFTVPDGELRYVSYVMWDDCRKSCMADVLTCPYGQAIKNGRCQSVVPDVGDCLGRSVCEIISLGVSPNISCFKACDCLTTEHPVPDSTTSYFYEEISCGNVKDDSDKLNDLRLSDDVNKTLPSDLLIDSNASADLDVSASMKVALESYAVSKESTQLDLLSESKIQNLQLVSANSKLSDIESTLKNFSAVTTSNQKVIEGSLNGIKGGIDTSNTLLSQLVSGQGDSNILLEDIKGLLGDSNTSTSGDSNTSTSDYAESDSQSTDRNNIDGSLSQIYTFLENVSTDYNNMKSMLDGGISAPSMSSGSTPTFCTTVFGRELCINLCDSFGQFYSVFYYIFTALFLLASLKIYYLAFKMRV